MYVGVILIRFPPLQTGVLFFSFSFTIMPCVLVVCEQGLGWPELYLVSGMSARSDFLYKLPTKNHINISTQCEVGSVCMKMMS